MSGGRRERERENCEFNLKEPKPKQGLLLKATLKPKHVIDADEGEEEDADAEGEQEEVSNAEAHSEDED